MCILLKFNQRPQWSYQEIADETEIPERDLMRAMQSLTMGKIGQRVLARTGEGSKVRKKRRHETACRVHRTLYTIVHASMYAHGALQTYKDIFVVIVWTIKHANLLVGASTGHWTAIGLCKV